MAIIPEPLSMQLHIIWMNPNFPVWKEIQVIVPVVSTGSTRIRADSLSWQKMRKFYGLLHINFMTKNRNVNIKPSYGEVRIRLPEQYMIESSDIPKTV